MMKSTQFTLWLEFENTEPWNDKFNDFANISVLFDDGRAYGINVWTYEFLKTAINEDLKEGKDGNYQVPPDLFVKELTRECIQSVIEELLEQGNLEDILNPSIFYLSCKEPWWNVMEMEDLGESLKQELIKELGSTHALFGQNVNVIARRQDNDDILVRLNNGKLALVHLTWSGKAEPNNFPRTSFFCDEHDFWQNKMKFDIIEFNEE